MPQLDAHSIFNTLRSLTAHHGHGIEAEINQVFIPIEGNAAGLHPEASVNGLRKGYKALVDWLHDLLVDNPALTSQFRIIHTDEGVFIHGPHDAYSSINKRDYPDKTDSFYSRNGD